MTSFSEELISFFSNLVEFLPCFFVSNDVFMKLSKWYVFYIVIVTHLWQHKWKTLITLWVCEFCEGFPQRENSLDDLRGSFLQVLRIEHFEQRRPSLFRRRVQVDVDGRRSDLGPARHRQPEQEHHRPQHRRCARETQWLFSRKVQHAFTYLQCKGRARTSGWDTFRIRANE